MQSPVALEVTSASAKAGTTLLQVQGMLVVCDALNSISIGELTIALTT